MSDTKDRYFLLKVQHCPMHGEVTDDKSYFKECMDKCFGDDHKVVNCERVKSSEKTLFCEMIVKATQFKSASLPTEAKLVMEFDRGLL